DVTPEAVVGKTGAAAGRFDPDFAPFEHGIIGRVGIQGEAAFPGLIVANGAVENIIMSCAAGDAHDIDDVRPGEVESIQQHNSLVTGSLVAISALAVEFRHGEAGVP